MFLNEIALNKYYKILSITNIEENFKRRLEELGLYENSIVRIIKFSPLKQTILLQIFNSVFAIKTKIAKSISVVEV